ncbi:zinc finger MYND domain-containing protein 15 [Clonorchis sinensis]|uniref:Zinc finger MYND domain-containing protein 15 n=1 Tax=Clonorchis sinensis TaxID=79923 RepID=G7YJS0_CLOSI|nr:zinc finger MYND domain-containing protein 15 [Clonorchis sinensis]
MAQFLTAYGVFNMGLWKYEHPFGTLEPSVKAAGPPGSELHLFCALWNVSTLDTPHHDPRCNVRSKSPSATVSSEDAMLRAYCLPMESILLSLCPTIPQTLETRHNTLVAVFLSDWAEYYIWRGFANPPPSQSLHGDWSEFSSPIAILLHWPLTIYYVLAHIFPKTNERDIQSVFEKGVLIIHVVGVEHELSMLPVFLELAYLLNPDLSVRLFFIGTDFSPAVDRHIFNLSSRLSVIVCSSTYHEFIRDSLPHLDRPHLVIGFNSGLAAYGTWTPTLKLIHALNVPTYFTDSCLYSCAWGYRVAHCLGVGVDEYHPECGTVLDDLEGTGVSAPILNPFRSPIRLQSSGARWGWFRNAFIYAPIRRTAPSTHPQGESDLLSKLTSLQL